MKLVVDEEKENKCNGIEMPNNTEKNSPKKLDSNGDINSEEPLGPGDLLVERTTKPNGNDDEFQNGNKTDDSASNSSSCSNFVAQDIEDDLSDDMTLRLSDDEDCEHSSVEKDNYSTLPLPSKNFELTQEELVDKTFSDVEAITIVNEITNDSNIDIEEETKLDNETNEDLIEIDENKIDKTDKNVNLDNLLINLNDETKAAIVSENKGITITELRQEVEEFIKSHDNEEENTNDENKSNTETTKKNLDINTEENVQIEETQKSQIDITKKSDIIDETVAVEILEVQSNETSDSQNCQKKEENNTTSVTTENNTTDNITESQEITDNKSEINEDNSEPMVVDVQQIEEKPIKADVVLETSKEVNESQTESETKDIEIKEKDERSSEELKGCEDFETRTCLKRTIEPTEDLQEAKKLKLKDKNENDEKTKKDYVSLNFFREFMSKREIKTLSREELEELCLQKICEAIVQHSKVGELCRLMKQQDNVVDALRNKCTSLTKQVRDLEVVHSRLMQEIRTKTKENMSEVTPVKITRSVGLQVSLTSIASKIRLIPSNSPEHIQKKKIPRLSPPKLISIPNKSNTLSPMATPSKTQIIPTKSPLSGGKGIKTILPKVTNGVESIDPASNSSLLGFYLQKPGTSPTSSPTTLPKKATNPEPSTDSATKVIDLTDEDDSSKSVSSPGIRVVSSQQLTTIPATSGTTSLPRVTYLVQGSSESQPVLLATSNTNTPSRPGQVRPTIFFKPIAPGIVNVVNKSKRLSIKTKIDLINKYKKGVPLQNLVNKFGIRRQSIHYLLKKEGDIKKRLNILKQVHGNLKNTKIKGIESSQLDLCVYKWYLQKKIVGEPISAQMLRHKAIFFNNRLGGPTTFRASTGWYSRFKARHGIHKLCISGEELSNELKKSGNFGVELKIFLEKEGIDLEHVYSADETGLAYKAMPTETFEKDDPDRKIDENRLTMLVCANATGRHKIPLLVIGKYKKPRCLENISRLPVHYRAQSNAWMDKQIFLDWYKNIFLPEVKQKSGENVKYVLLLDSAPSHPPLDELNAIDTNCKIIYLSPRTALIQPMGQGIISNLKKLYKTDLLRALVLQNHDDNAYIENFLRKLNLLDCIYSLANCWDRVNENCLQNAWNKLWRLKNSTSEDVNSNVEEITKLANHIIKDINFSSRDIVNWLEGDNWYPVFFYMNDEEILQHQGQDYIEQAPDDEDPNEYVCTDIVPSNVEIGSACEVLLRWVKTKGEDSVVQLNTLCELKKTMFH